MDRPAQKWKFSVSGGVADSSVTRDALDGADNAADKNDM